jgi:hypothetical protein
MKILVARYRFWRLGRLVTARDRADARSHALHAAVMRLRRRMGMKAPAAEKTQVLENLSHGDWDADSTRGLR